MVISGKCHVEVLMNSQLLGQLLGNPAQGEMGRMIGAGESATPEGAGGAGGG